MADQKFVIELAGAQRVTIEETGAWLEQVRRGEPEPAQLRLRLDDEADTEGHAFAATRIRVIADSGDDSEGHVMSLTFPSLEEAAAFRKRLLASGVLVGTVALGAVAGAGLANLAGSNPGDGAGAGAGAAVSVQSGPTAGSTWTQDERQDPDDEWVLLGGAGYPRPE